MSDEDRLVECFSHVFPTLSHADIRAADMTRLGIWDSAALLRLLSRVEREFKIRFEPDQINRLTSFRATLDLIHAVVSPAGRSGATPKGGAGGGSLDVR